MTTTSPSTSRNPASSAAALPALRRSRTTLTLSSRSWSRTSAACVPSREPSSTNTTSQGSPRPASAATSSLVERRRRSAPRRGRGRRPRSRARAYPVCSVIAVAELLTVEEALARVLERARPLPAEEVAARARGGPRARRGRLGPSSTCRASRARRWTASRFAPPTRPGRSPSSPGSRQAARPPGRSRPGEAMGIATGGVVPEGADAVVPIERVTDEGDDRRRAAAPSPTGDERPSARRRRRRAVSRVLAAGTS